MKTTTQREKMTEQGLNEDDFRRRDAETKKTLLSEREIEDPMLKELGNTVNILTSKKQ